MAVIMSLSIFTACNTAETSVTTASSEEVEESSAVSSVIYTGEVPSTDVLISGFTSNLLAYHPGEMGYGLKNANGAYRTFLFAQENDMDIVDPDLLKANLEDIINKMSEQERQEFLFNFMSIEALIEECYNDKEYAEGVFNDIEAEDMTELMYDSKVHNSWVALKGVMDAIINSSDIDLGALG